MKHADGSTERIDAFHHIASAASVSMGRPWAFVLAVLVVLVWALTGPVFEFSEVWQLVINTSTTIVTFLMVFLIQATQNRDSRAIHLKLDELIRTSTARDAFAGLEDATEAELERFHAEFRALHQAGMHPLQAVAEAKEQVLPSLRASAPADPPRA